ncbi:MAG: hypothetical protein M1825_003342 [Sarcosagium campestre]|nr:MAG: hypothetical protein M1825_003342 [Sarcosagium campestre]
MKLSTLSMPFRPQGPKMNLAQTLLLPNPDQVVQLAYLFILLMIAVPLVAVLLCARGFVASSNAVKLKPRSARPPQIVLLLGLSIAPFQLFVCPFAAYFSVHIYAIPRPMDGPIFSGLSAIDTILTCNICLSSIKDLPERDGLDLLGNGSRHGAKLYLTECGHLVCSSHLSDGGVPFHRASESSRALCPICVEEKDNTDPVVLFPISGAEEGLHHPLIPTSYFVVPQDALDSDRALRWQYLTLLRNGKSMHRRMTQLEDEVEELLEKVQRLESSNAILTDRSQAWKRRIPAIVQNLKTVRGLIDENVLLKRRLRELEAKTTTFERKDRVHNRNHMRIRTPNVAAVVTASMTAVSILLWLKVMKREITLGSNQSRNSAFCPHLAEHITINTMIITPEHNLDEGSYHCLRTVTTNITGGAQQTLGLNVQSRVLTSRRRSTNLRKAIPSSRALDDAGICRLSSIHWIETTDSRICHRKGRLHRIITSALAKVIEQAVSTTRDLIKPLDRDFALERLSIGNGLGRMRIYRLEITTLPRRRARMKGRLEGNGVDPE